MDGWITIMYEEYGGGGRRKNTVVVDSNNILSQRPMWDHRTQLWARSDASYSEKITRLSIRSALDRQNLPCLPDSAMTAESTDVGQLINGVEESPQSTVENWNRSSCIDEQRTTEPRRRRARG